MLEYLHEHFTIDVTDADIVAANRGVWFDDPIRRAVMRVYKLAYPVDVRVGWGYADIYFPNETDKFDVLPDKAVTDFLHSYQNGWLVKPATFTFRLYRIVAKKPILDTKPRRYAKDIETRLNRPPGKLTSGM